MDEMIKKLLTAILVVLIINTIFVATLLFNGKTTEKVTSDVNVNESEEEESTEYDTSKMESIDYNKFKELMNGEEKSMVLFARSTCGYCVKFMPILNNAIDKNNLKVYYLDVTTLSSDNVNDTKSLEPFADGIGTPTLVVVGNGNLIAHNVGYVDASALNSFLKENEFIK